MKVWLLGLMILVSMGFSANYCTDHKLPTYSTTSINLIMTALGVGDQRPEILPAGNFFFNLKNTTSTDLRNLNNIAGSWLIPMDQPWAFAMYPFLSFVFENAPSYPLTVTWCPLYVTTNAWRTTAVSPVPTANMVPIVIGVSFLIGGDMKIHKRLQQIFILIVTFIGFSSADNYCFSNGHGSDDTYQNWRTTVSITNLLVSGEENLSITTSNGYGRLTTSGNTKFYLLFDQPWVDVAWDKVTRAYQNGKTIKIQYCTVNGYNIVSAVYN